jgi:hypothetical protein
MANWLEKALGREEAEPVQSVPFSLSCQCGFQLKGQRQERAKRIICSKCGVGHFILPVNRYPTSERSFFADEGQVGSTAQQPKVKKKRPAADVDRAAEQRSSNEDNDPFIEDSPHTEPELDLVEAAWSTPGNQPAYDDDDLDDDDDDGDDYELADSDAEIELPAQLPRSKKKKKRAASSPARKEKRAASPSPPSSSDKKTKPVIQLPAATDGRSKQRLRLAAVSVLIFVFAAVMVAVAIRGVNRDQAEIAMRDGRDIGEAALRARDFATARQKLGEAFRAMELLDIDQQTRDETRKLWLQAEAGFGLLDSTDVVEIALLAEEMIPEPDEDGKVDDEDWHRQFHTQFFDRWLCIQLNVVETVSGDDDFGRRVVFPAAPLIHLSGVDAVLNEMSDGRLWFAGPIKSCQRDPIDDSVWLVEFDSSRVIACDRTQPLVRPMLSEEEQKAVAAALPDAATAEQNDDDEDQEPNDE